MKTCKYCLKGVTSIKSCICGGSKTRRLLYLKKRYYQHNFVTFIKHLKRGERRRKSSTISIKPFDLWKIAKHQRLICPLTGRKLNASNMSLDHIIPLSKGGTHDIVNLRFVHIDANYAKRNLTDLAFINMCKDVINHKNAFAQALVPNS